MTALPTTTFKFVFHFARKQWLKFSVFILVSMSWAFNDTIFPYLLKRIVNTLQDYHGDPLQIYAAVKWILAAMVFFWIVIEFLQRTQGILQAYTFPIFRANIRKAVFGYVKSHSQDYFASNLAGSIAKKLADLPNSCQMIMEIICFQFITAVTFSTLVIVMMWMIKPFFAYIVIIWLSIHIGLTVLSLRYTNKLWEVHSDAVSTLSGKIVDVFSNIMTVRLFARGDYEAAYLQNFQQDEISKSKKAMLVMELIRIGLGLNGLFLVFGMVFALLYGWSHGWVTVGDFTQVGMQSFWLLGWIWFIGYQITVFAREVGVVGGALTIVQKSHDLVDEPNAHPIQVTHGEIVFDSVIFAYNQDRHVFRELNIRIAAGQKLGLVGFSGSGKSTFVNLILRFYDLQSGRILIDQQDIAQVKQDSLRSQIAMIPQEPALFHRTLMENIRYGRLAATDAEVIAAAKLAHCHEFIEKLDDQYESLVGERGIKLSGGQRQRIAIARAILKNAPILILDEATSSLDSVTEKLIQESLHQLMQNRTTIVVAHRLSTLADMDRILVFHQGKIIEDGTKEELLELNGHFAKLWNMQTDGFLPDENE